MGKPAYLLAFATLILTAATLAAHDTWLVPVPIESGFRVTPGQPVKVALNTSEDFPTSEAAPTPDRIARFTFHTGDDRWRVGGELKYRVEGKSLVAELTPGTDTLVVAMTHPRLIVLPANQFNEYITAERLEDVVLERSARGQSGLEGRERYSKIAKLILCAGPVGEIESGIPVGLPLEVVPWSGDPCAIKVGQPLRMRVYFQGKPLPNARVGAGTTGTHGHDYPIWEKTDSDGFVALTFDRPGAWFVRTLHMVPSTEFEDADWRSWFSTLTFEVR